MDAADFLPQRSSPAARPEVDNFAANVVAERKRLADLDPDGEADAVRPVPPAEVRIATAAADLASQRERIARLGDRLRSPDGIDAADLLELDIPPLAWIVPDLVPEGTTVVASPPKIGKSCLVYQIVVETSLGGELFGRRVTPGSALYLALEDGSRRGRDRLVAALAGRTMPRGRLEVRWAAPAIGQGLEDEISRWLDAHPDATVVAIDTLGKVRGRGERGQNAYQVDVDDLGRLQALFRDRRVALLIVHHSRKEAGDDFLASVSGTYGLTGSADTIVVIKRKRLEAFGSINVTGRDVPDAEITVRFDGLTWQAAPAAIDEASFERREVFEVIEKSGPIFPAAIAAALDLERTSVQHMVGKLLETGAVTRTTGGYVAAAPPIYPPITVFTPGVYGVNGDIEEYAPGAFEVDPEPAA